LAQLSGGQFLLGGDVRFESVKESYFLEGENSALKNIENTGQVFSALFLKETNPSNNYSQEHTEHPFSSLFPGRNNSSLIQDHRYTI
jgi:hypothetical protein